MAFGLRLVRHFFLSFFLSFFLFSTHLVMYNSCRASRCGGTGGGVPASVPADCPQPTQPVRQQAMQAAGAVTTCQE
jgi:hypothetical protein